MIGFYSCVFKMTVVKTPDARQYFLNVIHRIELQIQMKHKILVPRSN